MLSGAYSVCSDQDSAALKRRHRARRLRTRPRPRRRLVPFSEKTYAKRAGSLCASSFPNSQFGYRAAGKYIASEYPPIPHENNQQLATQSRSCADADEPVARGLVRDTTTAAGTPSCDRASSATTRADSTDERTAVKNGQSVLPGREGSWASDRKRRSLRPRRSDCRVKNLSDRRNVIGNQSCNGQIGEGAGQ